MYDLIWQLKQYRQEDHTDYIQAPRDAWAIDFCQACQKQNQDTMAHYCPLDMESLNKKIR